MAHILTRRGTAYNDASLPAGSVVGVRPGVFIKSPSATVEYVYKGSRTASQVQLGTRTEAQLYLGIRDLFP